MVQNWDCDTVEVILSWVEDNYYLLEKINHDSKEILPGKKILDVGGGYTRKENEV